MIGRVDSDFDTPEKIALAVKDRFQNLGKIFTPLGTDQVGDGPATWYKIAKLSYERAVSEARSPTTRYWTSRQLTVWQNPIQITFDILSDLADGHLRHNRRDRSAGHREKE